jgi:hypothetical protein
MIAKTDFVNCDYVLQKNVLHSRKQRTASLQTYSILKMKAVCSSETLVSTYNFTQRYNPEDRHQQRSFCLCLVTRLQNRTKKYELVKIYEHNEMKTRLVDKMTQSIVVRQGCPLSPSLLYLLYILYTGIAVPLHEMEALGGRGGIAPTHSRPRH